MISYELMKARLENVAKLEKNMLRDLTEEEKDYIMENGVNPFIEKKLEFSKDDDFTFKRVKALISAYCTQSEPEFYNQVYEQDNGSALLVLKTICNALEEAELIKKNKKEAVPEAVLPKVAEDEKLNEDELFGEGETKDYNYTTDTLLSYVKPLLDLFGLDVSFKDVTSENKDSEKCEKFDRVTECDGNCENCDWISYLIGRLKEGEELELSQEEINTITDRLWESEDNVSIKVVNNKISAKF